MDCVKNVKEKGANHAVTLENVKKLKMMIIHIQYVPTLLSRWGLFDDLWGYSGRATQVLLGSKGENKLRGIRHLCFARLLIRCDCGSKPVVA